MQDTAGEVETCSLVIYSGGPLHMDEQRQDNQLEPIYNSSVPIRDVAMKTYRKQWTIGRGGERWSGIAVLVSWDDDDVSPYFKACPRGVMVKAMNCGIVVREFVLQSRYYVHFRANTLGKGMNPLILPPAMGK